MRIKWDDQVSLSGDCFAVPIQPSGNEWKEYEGKNILFHWVKVQQIEWMSAFVMLHDLQIPIILKEKNFETVMCLIQYKCGAIKEKKRIASIDD